MLTASDRFRGTARFDLLTRLGQGGMGVVYEAFDRERNVKVALKTITTLTPDTLLRFKNEFRALQDLQHPNLVRLDELFEDEGTWFFTMELIDGVDFLRYVRPLAIDPETGESMTATVVDAPPRAARDAEPAIPARLPSGPLDEARLRHATRQLVQALSTLHDAGKVHRDIKPANILVTRDDRVVLVDFGLVTGTAPQSEGRAVGTVAFMAPEQIADAPVGPAADWYAVGATVYCALTGQPPFTGAKGDVLARKRREEPPPPRRLDASIPADLDQLCVDLLRCDPADRPSGAEIQRRVGLEPSLPAAPQRGALFVGRDAELAALRGACDDVIGGRAVAVLVHGESGVGKSTLVERFLGGLAAPSAVVLAGRCYERESVPYKALDQAIDQLSGHLARMRREEVDLVLPARIGLVAEVFPALRKVPAIDEASQRALDARSADPFQSRRAVFDTLRELLARLAGDHTVVIGIDDLQWADADSLALLAHLLHGPGAPPLLLCATVRTSPELATSRLDALRARLGDDVRDLVVERLPPATARALVDELVRAAGGAELRAESVAAEAAGHPLFIEALVRHQLVHPGSAGPLRLDDALVARAGDLEPAAAAVLELVCVAGAPVPQEACAEAAGLPFAEVGRLIAVLRGAHLVRTHGVRRGDSIEAYHDRVREAVLARLEPETRRPLHRRLGRALEASGGADPELLAIHLAEAGDHAAAAHWADRAAARASTALAFEQAARLCRWALELDPTGEAVPRLRVRLADALGSAGRGGDAADQYLAAADDAPPGEQLELRRRAAEQLLISGRIDEGVRVLRTVLDAVGLKMPATPRRALASLLVNRAKVRLRGGGLRARLRDPSAIPAEVLTRIDTCWSASMGLAIVDPIRGADFQTRHLLLALDAGDPFRIACGLAAEAGFSAASGGPARRRTEKVLRAAEALAEQVGDPHAHAYTAFAGGTADYLVGRWASSLALLDRAETLFRERCSGTTWWIDTTRFFAIECLAYAGDSAELCRRVPAYLADAESRGDLFAATNFQIGIPNLAWLLRDDVEGALRHGADAMASWSHQGFHIQHVAELLSLGQTDLYTGDGPSAYRRVLGGWDAITGAVIFRVQLTRIATYHQRARAALAAASSAAAGSGARRELVADARFCARKIARERMPWSDPFAALARAGAAHLTGDDDTSRAELVVAIDGFDAAGMALYAGCARRRLGALEGGSAGTARIAAATAAMESGAVRRPDRVTDMFAPGFR